MAPTPEIMEIALAGLLHDLGKFRHRTGLEVTNERNLSYCPNVHGRPSHVHVAHTAQAIEDLFEPKGLRSGAVFRYAVDHHRQDVRGAGERIIQMADRIASGHDRNAHREYSEAMAAAEVAQQADFIKARQIPAICRVSIQGRGPAGEKMVYPLSKLGPDVLPIAIETLSREAACQEYLELWKMFVEEVHSTLPDFRTEESWIGALTSLLELYTWAIPASSYKNLPETSLFDHGRLVAAVGCVLYRHYEERGLEAVEGDYSRGEPLFRVIQGEFAGIQKFIFDFRGESERYAAKMLRARSFHVSLMTEAVASLVCKRFGLPGVAVVMNAGGKFTIIAPNLPQTGDWIMEIGEAVDQEMFETTFGQTRFALASVEARASDFSASRKGHPSASSASTDHDFGSLLEDLSRNLQSVKTRPTVPVPVFANFLRELGEREVCATCGIRPAGEKDLCSSCADFRKIGEALVRRGRRFVCLRSSKTGFKLIGGLRYSFHAAEDLPDKGLQIDLGNPSHPGRFRGVAIRRLAAHVPVFESGDRANPLYDGLAEGEGDPGLLEGAHKTFQHIGRDACTLRAGQDRRPERVGRDHIAVLKADVDNLGEVFCRGFEERSISRMVGMSRMLDYFFTGWLPSLLAERYGSTYTVFAGGDDLLLVGPWKQSVALAGEIRSHLEAYAGGNPSITISAGLTITRPSSPLRQAIDLAEVDLGLAKDSRHEDTAKDAITAFGQTVIWRHFGRLLEISDTLRDLLESGVAEGFVYRLFEFARMREAEVEDVMNTRWRALFRYSVYRNYALGGKREDLLPRLLEIPEWIEKYGACLTIALSNALYQRRR